MKRLLLVITAIFIIAGGTASATSQANLHYQGIWCKTHAASKAILCIRESGDGYGVGINRFFVMIYNLQTGKTVKVYFHSAAH